MNRNGPALDPRAGRGIVGVFGTGGNCSVMENRGWLRMADASKEEYQIILEKVTEDRQPDAALFLSGCFSLPPASTRGIAASGPIALITGITRLQADMIMAELAISLPAGVSLRVADALDSGKVSRLQWPRPPRIYGRELSEFASDAEGHSLKCPVCGGMIRVYRDSGGNVGATVLSGSERKRKSSRRADPANDKDPLFSGIKPLATGTSDFASIRSLQAGDTGFWMDRSRNIFAPPPEHAATEEKRLGEGSNAKKSTVKVGAGLAAFMKPGAFSLVVGRTRDPQVVKMIADIMGIGKDEAREKGLNLSLCVVRDISLDEAQNLLSRFRGLGAKARIVKPM